MKKFACLVCAVVMGCLVLAAAPAPAFAAKKILLIAGGPSHGYGDHEHFAGCTLLAKCLNENVAGVEATVSKGWPKDPAALERLATIVIFSDGGGGHLAIPHLKELGKLMKQGVGLTCIHYAVELPKGKPGDSFKDWIGGYFEQFWSVNPTYKADFKALPNHPVANGVKPFNIVDEWYYHMRFQDDMAGVRPILSAVPPDSTRRNENTAYGGNPAVFARKGMPEHLCWVRERPDGGRGFGFTGGHFHWNWACDPFRTVVLNGIVWTAGLEVPAGGVPSKTPTYEELLLNQDEPQPANFNADGIRKLLESFRK
jgi:type 1 glutamine amidotransferase